MTTLSRRAFLGATAGAGVAALTGCTPGMSGGGVPRVDPNAPVSTDVAAAGKVTLTEWDQNTNGGIADAQTRLNAEFQKRYPNVTIKRVTRSFSDLKTTLRLALSSADPPDAVQANQGYPDMGAFVEGGLLQPVGRYARAYGWTKRFPAQLLSLNTFSADGTRWQTGELFGVSQTGEIVGLYYNKKILARLGLRAPRTFDDLQALLPRIKAKGVVPLVYGDSDKSPGIHLFGTVQASTAGKVAVRGLVQSRSGAWTDPTTLGAARIIADWAAKGYLSAGANGQSSDQAVENFGKGAGPLLIDGTWQQATLTKALGANVGFVALAAAPGQPPVAEGGEGLAWALTSRSRHPDVAAAYVNFITGARASQVMIDTGNLPAVLPAGFRPRTGTLPGDIAASWQQISTQDGLLPYLDYTTPTFYDTLTAAVQELTSKQLSPEDFVATLQADHVTFDKSR